MNRRPSVNTALNLLRRGAFAEQRQRYTARTGIRAKIIRIIERPVCHKAMPVIASLNPKCSHLHMRVALPRIVTGKRQIVAGAFLHKIHIPADARIKLRRGH